MQHGIYITEFEHALSERGFAVSHQSLAQLVNQIDFAKLEPFSEGQRAGFYRALIEQVPMRLRGLQAGLQVLGEVDAHQIITAMTALAATGSLPASWIREMWCLLFIGGCP